MKKNRTLLSSIPLFVFFYLFIVVPSLAQPQVGTVTLRVGEGAGFLGSLGNPVAVALDNPDDIVEGIQVDICDEDDFLVATGCETTDRTAAFNCASEELPDGCDRILLFSATGGLIQKGAGPVFTLTYAVSGEAPEEECRELSQESAIIFDETRNVLEVALSPGIFCFQLCTADTDCDDGVYCNGEETCDEGSGICQPDNNPCPPNTRCNEATENCDTITTTTTPPTGCAVTIIPQSETVVSGGTVSLSADTAGEGCATGDYEWSIEESDIASEIDQGGQYTAGSNTTEFPVIDIIKVVDHANGDKIAFAAITVESEGSTTGCTVTIIPQVETVVSGGTVSLSADTAGEECATGNYEWSIEESDITSEINQEGQYTTGSNTTGAPVIDIIKVVDHANGDKIAFAAITVESEGTGSTISIFPPKLVGLPWIPWPYLLLIKGEGTAFNLNSQITFEPGDDIVKLFHIGFGEIMFVPMILRANPQEGTVRVTITTEEEVATGEMTIEMLSLLPEAGQ